MLGNKNLGTLWAKCKSNQRRNFRNYDKIRVIVIEDIYTKKWEERLCERFISPFISSFGSPPCLFCFFCASRKRNYLNPYRHHLYRFLLDIVQLLHRQSFSLGLTSSRPRQWPSFFCCKKRDLQFTQNWIWIGI